MSDETTKRIGDYEILKELGAGGMGKVYQVRNVITDRIEAMKVLLPDLASTPDLAARFLREVKLTASLDHPNICALRTAFSNDNRLYMVMEYVEGTTMATKLDMGPLSVNDAVKYISQVLSAVSYAHQRHIIHRDIKPANMMLTTQGVIKLMDFGIARSGDERGLTMTGTTMGSIGYMSPEQVKGDPTDARSDLYSVGIVSLRIRDRPETFPGQQRVFDHGRAPEPGPQAASRTESRAAGSIERNHSHGDCQRPGKTLPGCGSLRQRFNHRACVICGCAHGSADSGGWTYRRQHRTACGLLGSVADSGDARHRSNPGSACTADCSYCTDGGYGADCNFSAGLRTRCRQRLPCQPQLRCHRLQAQPGAQPEYRPGTPRQYPVPMPPPRPAVIVACT